MTSFILASLICIVAPGPDNIMVLSTGISQGRRAGMGFAIGCGLGCVTHALWAALGISALIMTSALAFQLVKYVGAAYLFYLAYLSFRSGSLQIEGKKNVLSVDARLTPYIAKGFLANALNPKVAIFFLAFLPQFIIGDLDVSWQMLVLGSTFGAMTTALFFILGFFSGQAGQWLSKKPLATKWLDRVAGAIFIGLGLRLVSVSNK